MTGFVYAMVSGENVKIGWSGKPQLRVNKVRSDTPCDVRLIGFVEATPGQEVEIQKLLEPWRVFGEWFQLSALPVAAFVAALRGRGLRKTVKKHPLQAYLHAQNLTDADFGILVQRSRWAVRKWMYGQRVPRSAELVKIAAVTSGAVTPNDFLPPQSMEQNA